MKNEKVENLKNNLAKAFSGSELEPLYEALAEEKINKLKKNKEIEGDAEMKKISKLIEADKKEIKKDRIKKIKTHNKKLLKRQDENFNFKVKFLELENSFNSISKNLEEGAENNDLDSVIENKEEDEMIGFKT